MRLGYFLSSEEWGPKEQIEQASTLLTEEMVGEAITCGPAPEKHVAQIKSYFDAGYDEVFVQQIGPNQREFFDFYEREILPEFR